MPSIDPQLVQGSKERLAALAKLKTGIKTEHEGGIATSCEGIDLTDPDIAKAYYYLMKTATSTT